MKHNTLVRTSYINYIYTNVCRATAWNSYLLKWRTEGPGTSCSTQVSSPFCCRHHGIPTVPRGLGNICPIVHWHACEWWCWAFSKLQHSCSKLPLKVFWVCGFVKVGLFLILYSSLYLSKCKEIPVSVIFVLLRNGAWAPSQTIS